MAVTWIRSSVGCSDCIYAFRCYLVGRYLYSRFLAPTPFFSSLKHSCFDPLRSQYQDLQFSSLVATIFYTMSIWTEPTLSSVAVQFWEIDSISDDSRDVSALLEGLAKRDSRFLFIQESFDEFLHGEFWLHEAATLLEDALCNILGRGEMRVPNQRRYRSTVQEDHYYRYLSIILDDIVSTAIYELLNVFDTDITLGQARRVDRSLGENVGLLKALYEKSKELVPQPANTIPPNDSTSSSEERHHYRYQNRLELSNIRVLCIHPGLENNPIECRLEKRSLDTDEIEEALSYIWGEPISLTRLSQLTETHSV